MLITDSSVKRPVFAMVCSMLLVAFGMVAYMKLPLRQYPDIDPPVVSVETVYRGAAAATIESRITRIVEDAVSGIEGIRTLQSLSEDGRSAVTIEFTLKRDIEDAANDVRDRIARVVQDLPEEAEPPEVFKVDANTDPVMWINLGSTSMNSLELTEYADRVIVDALAVVDGVAQVRVAGGRIYAMRIMLRPDAMAAHGVTTEDIEMALQRENVELPAGRIESTQRDYALRLMRGYQTPEAMGRLVVGRGGDGQIIHLEQVAEIRLGAESERSELRGNGEQMVGLGVIKQSQANTIEVARNVRVKLEELSKNLPNDTRLYPSYDSSLFISASLDEVYETLVIALVLVVLVIYVFLGSLRATIIPALAVPVSLISAFMLLLWLDYSLNLLTLLAMVLAIGLVVDDAIIMLEHIQRKVDDGEHPLRASLEGARQVSMPIIATSLVLCAVFVPITFLAGNVGRLFTEFAVTMIATILFSMVVALTLSPALCSMMLRRSSAKGASLHQWFGRIEQRYSASLALSLRHGRWIGCAMVLMLVAMALLYRSLPEELVPSEDRGVFFVRFTAPEGASYGYAERYARRLEQDLMPLVERGDATRILMRIPGNFSTSDAVNSGLAIVVLKPWAQRARSVFSLVGEVMPKIASYEGVTAFPIIPQGLNQGFGQAVEFVVRGSTYEELGQWRDVLLEKFASYPGITGLDSDYKETQPQWRIHIHHERAGDMGVTPAQIGHALETFLASRRVTTFDLHGEEYDVILEADRTLLGSRDAIMALQVRSSTTGAMIRLDNLISIEEVGTAGKLNRYHRQRAVTLSANVADGYSLGEVLDHLEGVARESLPPTAMIDYKGQSLEYRDASSDAIFVFIMALLVVYLVLAAQFESFIHPLVIMMTVPLALLWGLIGMWVGGVSINLYSMIGLLMLMGLATKNGILIVEFTNKLRDEGMDHSTALRQAATLRLRPIIMTSITAVMGAFPLIFATGAGAESRYVLGMVIVFGVSGATILTLYVIPWWYDVIGKFGGSPHRVEKMLREL
ncbi:MAG: efflux RND transporter permease subunit [Alphaproteobacteria bacterium]|nr:MAG: efflux RND transporter permease subunit [Alphaproteobacteria bacterium]